MAKSKGRHRISLDVDKETFENMQALAKERMSPVTQVLRRMIRRAYLSLVEGKWVCHDGSSCRSTDHGDDGDFGG